MAKLRLGDWKDVSPSAGALALIVILVGAIIHFTIVGWSSEIHLAIRNACVIDSSREFERLLTNGRALAVMFSSDTCPVCRKLEPYWLGLCESGDRRFLVLKLTRDTLNIFTEFNIVETPTFIVFLDGKPIARHVGSFETQYNESIRRMMSEWVESSVETYELARETDPPSREGASLGTLSVPAALAAGFAAALSPCVFPLLLSYTSLLYSNPRIERSLSPAASSLAAASGVLVVGTLFLLVGGLVEGLNRVLVPAAGITLFAAGLLGLMDVPALVSFGIGRRRGLLGFSFAYGVLTVQCSFPLVAGVLMVIAVGGLSVVGLLTLAAFTAGVAIPVGLAVYSTGNDRMARLLARIASRSFMRYAYGIISLAGLLMLASYLGFL